MSRRSLQHPIVRVLAFAALAAYAGVGLVGYGLHDLSGVDHHHAACCGHGDEGAPDASTTIPSTTIAADDCSICSFLAQAQTSFSPELTLAGGEPLAEAPLRADSLVLSLRAAAPLARGPPTA